MSWEVMSKTQRACACGKSTVTYVIEMDDWNRVEDSEIINCADCFAKVEQEADERSQKERKIALLRAKACEIATKLYLDEWLNLHSGLSRRAVWMSCGYQSLTTFYKDVRRYGSVQQYLRSQFTSHFELALYKLEVRNREIERLLSEAKEIADQMPRSYSYWEY